MNIFLYIMLWTSYIISLYFSIFFIITFFENKHLFEKKNKIKLKKYSSVSVIIPAFNEEKTIIKTIKSVLNLDYPKELLNIIVVNDGSKDRTKEIVEEFIKDKKNIKLISHTNKGKGASLNIALKQIKSEFFACLDADSEVDSQTLKKMINLYYEEKDEKLGIITPALKVRNAQKFIEKMQRVEYLVMIIAAKISSILDCQYVAPGPFSLYKTVIIKRIGGFDERSLTEDQEIAYRAQLFNYKIRQCPDGYVYTRTPKTIKSFYKQRNRWYKGGLLTLYKYKKMILNKSYGDFGYFQLLKNTLAIYLSITALVFAGRYLFWPILDKINNLYLIDFDIKNYIRTFNFEIDFLGFDIRILIMLIALFIISITLFYYSHKYTKERILEKGFIPLIPYLFLYYILKAGIFFFVLVELIIKKKQKW